MPSFISAALKTTGRSHRGNQSLRLRGYTEVATWHTWSCKAGMSVSLYPAEGMESIEAGG